MVAVLAFLSVLQTPQVLTAAEIAQRLEAPVTMHTNPVRLVVALDELGSRVGVRIRCESELSAAVVVVGVKNRPAKEVLQYLVDGIGAGKTVYNGTVYVGLALISPELEEKRRLGARQSMVRTIDSVGKNASIDKPFDEAFMTRIGGLAKMTLQSAQDAYRPPHPDLYQVRSKSPVYRLYARLLAVIGPDALLQGQNGTVVIDQSTLSRSQRPLADQALARFAEEQNQCAQALDSMLKLAAKVQYPNVPGELLDFAEPLGKAEPNSFRMTIQPSQWSQSVNFEVRAGGLTVQELTEQLPKQRIYVRAVGETFNASQAANVKVDYGPAVMRFQDFRAPLSDGKAKPFDYVFAREFANAWKNEPLSYSKVQPLADVAAALDLNVVAYLSDQLLTSFIYDQSPVQQSGVTGQQVINFLGSVGRTGGLRKLDKYLLSFVQDPEQYLAAQMDRQSLTTMMNLAMRPGPLTFAQMSASFGKMGANYYYQARQLAKLVRPGFESLNPMDLQVLELMAKFNGGQLNGLRGGGIPVASLPTTIEQRMRRSWGIGRRYGRWQPNDTIDAPPTLDEYRKGVVKLATTSRDGLIAIFGSDDGRTSFTPYVYFNFQSFESFRGADPRTFKIENYLSSRICWPARLETISLVIEIPRKSPIQYQTSQYIADVSQAPIPYDQIMPTIQRYFGN